VALPLSVVHERGRLPGRAGRWLIADLRERMKTCPGAHRPLEVPAKAEAAAA
jgi:hypothetical protein